MAGLTLRCTALAGTCPGAPVVGAVRVSPEDALYGGDRTLYEMFVSCAEHEELLIRLKPGMEDFAIIRLEVEP